MNQSKFEISKLANKGALAIEMAKTRTIRIFESKIYASNESIEIKKESKNIVLIKKRNMKGEKLIALMDFAEYLRKSSVSENS